MPHVRTDDFDCWYAEDRFAEPWSVERQADATAIVDVAPRRGFSLRAYGN